MKAPGRPPKVHEQDVARAREELRASGKNPSVAAIHDLLDAGSFGTITKHLHALEDKETQAKELHGAPPLPDEELLAPFRLFYKAAAAKMAQERSAATAASRERQLELAAQRDAHVEELDSLSEKLQQASQQNANLLQQLAASQQNQLKANDEIRAWQEKAEAARDGYATAQVDLAVARERLKQLERELELRSGGVLSQRHSRGREGRKEG